MRALEYTTLKNLLYLSYHFYCHKWYYLIFYNHKVIAFFSLHSNSLEKLGSIKSKLSYSILFYTLSYFVFFYFLECGKVFQGYSSRLISLPLVSFVVFFANLVGYMLIIYREKNKNKNSQQISTDKILERCDSLFSIEFILEEEIIKLNN